MPLKEIEEILAKYTNEESKINNLLNKNDEQSIQRKKIVPKFDCTPMEEAIKRNKQLLEDLEMVKSALRSKAIYSPAEMQWSDICRQYQESTSLPVTTWRCNLPVFV